jgi:hypothetical protein
METKHCGIIWEQLPISGNPFPHSALLILLRSTSTECGRQIHPCLFLLLFFFSQHRPTAFIEKAFILERDRTRSPAGRRTVAQKARIQLVQVLRLHNYTVVLCAHLYFSSQPSHGHISNLEALCYWVGALLLPQLFCWLPPHPDGVTDFEIWRRSHSSCPDAQLYQCIYFLHNVEQVRNCDSNKKGWFHRILL